MEKERSHVTKRILNLTLEIIYLLTGEDYGPIKTLSGPLKSPSVVCKKGSNRKILEVIQKIIELLTGEEREHLQGCKDVMMEKRPPLTSADGSRNTPERCPRPLDSRDYTQEHQEELEEHHEIPQEDQKDIVTEDGKEGPYMREEEEELSSQTQDKGCSPMYSGDLEGKTLLDFKVEVKEEEETYVEESCKEEERPPEISSDGSKNRNAPERCPKPLYSREHQEIPQDDQEENIGKEKEETYIKGDEHNEEEQLPAEDVSSSPLYTEDFQEDYKILQDYQGETLMDIKVEIKEEEDDLYVSGDETFKKKEVPPEIITGGPQSRNRQPTFSLRGGEEDDDLLGYPQGADAMALYLQPGRHMSVLSSDPSIHEGSFPGQSHPIDYHAGDHMFPFSDHRERFIKAEGTYSHSNYGNIFNQNCLLQRHQSNHTWGNPYACSECGKSFKLKSAFLRHKRTHTEERPFSCTECGKSFTQRAHLVSHERIHTGVKPYCCSECGKCFSHKISLITHESFHTGVKPFFCSECGKQFSRKSVLILHERVHTGEKPYPCPECGKCFSQRTHLNTHRRSHTSERPFSCSECGKTYSRKSYLVDHLRTHTGVKPYACTVCGKCFSCKSNLITHQTIHSSKKPFSCVECGKCFQTRSAFTYHKKLHAAHKIPLC